MSISIHVVLNEQEFCTMRTATVNHQQLHGIRSVRNSINHQLPISGQRHAIHLGILLLSKISLQVKDMQFRVRQGIQTKMSSYLYPHSVHCAVSKSSLLVADGCDGLLYTQSKGQGISPTQCMTASIYCSLHNAVRRTVYGLAPGSSPAYPLLQFDSREEVALTDVSHL